MFVITGVQLTVLLTEVSFVPILVHVEIIGRLVARIIAEHGALFWVLKLEVLRFPLWVLRTIMLLEDPGRYSQFIAATTHDGLRVIKRMRPITIGTIETVHRPLTFGRPFL